MPKINWKWIKNEILPPKRRESAPPMPTEKYDPNAHRKEYKQAFQEFKQRGSLYNQSLVREVKVESDSKSTDAPTDQSNSNGEQHDQPQSDATKRRSLPNNKSRSVFSGSSQRKTNTANNTLVVNENNNSIYSNEIREFEDNCINDASFGATFNHSPPKTFYKNNSKPFSPNAQKASPNALKASPNAQKASPNAQKASPNAQKASPNAHKPLTIQSESSTTAPIHSESSSPARTLSKIEGSRQRACKKLFSYVRPKDKSEVSSNSSGAYRPYDFDSSLDDEEALKKRSNGQHIPKETYDEIANAFGDMAQRNGLGDERNKHNNSHNSSVPPIEHGNSGVSPQSALASFRRCEGVIDENFGFLDDTEWRQYCMDDSESSAANHDEPSIQVTDLDESVERLSEHDVSDHPEQQEVDTEDQCSRDTEPATSPQVNKHPIYVIECKAKDIKPKSSSLRNTTSTPFQLSSGSFRQTTVTLKKGCPRDSESMRLVEEAIERDFEILSKVKHPNIVILMAACFNRKLINHMTLVMEPVDYTLNFYLHQMGKTFTILESISIVQQISSAALYLQECGYIHSNISSHNVLFRERPCTVKLSSFELATDVDYAAIRAEVEKFCPQFCTSQSGNYSKTQQSIGAELDNIDLKKQYKELSKPPATFKRSTNAEHDYMGVPIKYLVYDTTYRQHLSVPNVTAPELLAIDQRFVFPTPKTDVYSLCLLLWELLNQCGPFAVYNRLDMQRMIASRKLNLPFFERERCYYLMDIFGAGLLIEPENRSLTVSQLIEQLENIELEILTGGEDIPVQSNERNGEIVEHDYVNGPQHAQSEYLDESFAVSKESAQLNDFVLSPDLLAFDQSLKKSERTSTKKMKKKPPRNPVVCRIRELFTQEAEPNPSENFYLTCGDAYPMQETADSAALRDSGDGNFVDLNRSFIEMSDDIRRHVFDDIEEDEKLNQNLADIAQDLCRNILNDTEDIKSFESRSQPSSNPKNSKTAPAVVGFSVKNKKLNDSKTHGGFLETPAAAAARKLFDFSTDGYDFNCDGGMHNSMPNFARQNYIRRNAWLSDQQPNTSNNDNESERMVKDDKKENSIDVNKKVNVSLRIVHNKMTPEKAPKNTNAATHERPSKAATEERPSKAATEERPSKAATKECPSRASTEERPSILSKIQFFNSANQASAAGTSLSNEKRLNAPVKAHEVTTSLSKQPTNRLTKSVNERVFAAVPSKEPKLVGNNTVASGTSKANRNVMGELTDIVHNLHNAARDPAQKKESFENKLWKRELDICNRSLNSSDGGNDMKIAAAKLRSVRETILKFEKRRHDATTSNESASNSSSTSNGELAKISSKPSISNQSTNRKPNDSPTLIKRTVYSEQIVSGIDLSPLDNQMFDKLNFGNKKVAARVSFRQTSSSDVAVTTRRRTDMRGLTICGSEVELLTFSDGNLNSSGVESSDGVTVCFNCASTMSSDELKALTHETLNISVNSDSIPLQESPTKRCQARVKTQDTRSIEDLYIDDDFVHGLGANMELQSNYSDSFDFDMISSGLF